MIDWQALFVPDVSFLEIFIRGTVMYLFLVLVMRFGMNRAMGTIGLTDMLVIVVIADASQNAMAGTYESITSGLFLVTTIVFWAFFFDWLCSISPAIERIMAPSRVCLIRNGHILRHNMRKELITIKELMAQLRLNGIDDVKQVKEACLEANGEFSVVKYEE